MNTQNTNDFTLSYSGLEIRLDQRRVIRDNVEVILSRYEYGVLCFLAQHPKTLFSKEEIYEAVWQETSESYLTAIKNTISRIRQKLKDDSHNPMYIKTVSNQGYMFIAEPR